MAIIDKLKEIGSEDIQKKAASSRVKVYRRSVTALAAAAALVRVLALIVSYDSDPGYFVTGAFLPGLFNALAVVALAVALSSLVLVPAAGLPKNPSFKTDGVYFTAVYAGFITLADAGYRIYNLIQPDNLEYIKAYFDRTSAMYQSGRSGRIACIVSIICIVASLGSAVCFFLRSGSKKGGMSLRVILGLFPILRATCGVGLLYFDMTAPMNSPNKVIAEFALMSSMIYFLAEDRFEISEDKAKPGVYFASALVSQILCAAFGFSVICGYFGGICDDGNIAVEAFFCLTLFLYIFMRTKAFEKACDPENGQPESGTTEADGKDENSGEAHESESAGASAAEDAEGINKTAESAEEKSGGAEAPENSRNGGNG